MVYDNNVGGEYAKNFVQELQEPAALATPEFKAMYGKEYEASLPDDLRPPRSAAEIEKSMRAEMQKGLTDMEAALKDLQGLVWEEGYASGALQGPIYPDVAPALRRWRDAGLGLAVYSSGSVKAQQLIYGHSNAGDLRGLFQHWFDTRIGSKQESASYRQIVTLLGTPAGSVLFISDSISELKAAASSGLAVLLCNRDENPSRQTESEEFAVIRSFEALDPDPHT